MVEEEEEIEVLRTMLVRCAGFRRKRRTYQSTIICALQQFVDFGFIIDDPGLPILMA